MTRSVFTVDGVNYNVGVKSVKRNFEVADSDSSGRTEDWVMHRDVVGTFYNYTIEIFVKDFDYDSYDKLYEVLSSPQTAHTIVVPYGRRGTKTFRAYVTKGSDKIVRIYDKASGRDIFWDGLSVNIIAMEPQRRA